MAKSKRANQENNKLKNQLVREKQERKEKRVMKMKERIAKMKAEEGKQKDVVIEDVEDGAQEMEGEEEWEKGHRKHAGKEVDRRLVRLPIKNEDGKVLMPPDRLEPVEQEPIDTEMEAVEEEDQIQSEEEREQDVVEEDLVEVEERRRKTRITIAEIASKILQSPEDHVRFSLG